MESTVLVGSQRSKTGPATFHSASPWRVSAMSVFNPSPNNNPTTLIPHSAFGPQDLLGQCDRDDIRAKEKVTTTQPMEGGGQQPGLTFYTKCQRIHLIGKFIGQQEQQPAGARIGDSLSGPLVGFLFEYVFCGCWKYFHNDRIWSIGLIYKKNKDQFV